MLASGMKEASSSRIVISDVETGTIEQMLEFVYTGKLTKTLLTDELLIELLYCADKYEFAQLKSNVLNQILLKLSIENAIKFVRAAKMYRGDEKIISALLKFSKT